MHPGLRILLQVKERPDDHIADDVNVECRLEPLEDSRNVGRPILRYRNRLVAGPR